jgi:hypothetical protein
MGLLRIPNGRSKPMKSALCKARVGIVVAKPPAPIPVVAVATRVQQVNSQTRPEYLRPLSLLQVPAIRGGFNRQPFVASSNIVASKHKNIVAKPKKMKPSPRRVLTQTDIEQSEFLAGHIVGILRYRLKAATKLTLISTFEGKYPAGAIARGIHIAMKRGDVVKDKTCKPAKYFIAPIATFSPIKKITPISTVEAGWTSVWNPPATTGWTTQL